MNVLDAVLIRRNHSKGSYVSNVSELYLGTSRISFLHSHRTCLFEICYGFPNLSEMGGQYIIKNAWVISVDKDIGDVADCDVVIENDLIVAVGRNLPHSSNHVVIDGTNAIVSPGFVDTHRHTWQTQTKTVATDHVLIDYFLSLRNVYGSSYSAHDAYLGNFCGALESINNGTTYIVDHSHIQNSPQHSDAAVKGLIDAKVRGVFCYALYKNPWWEGSTLDKEREEQTPDWRIEDARRIQQKFFQSNTRSDLLRFGFVPGEPDLTPFDELCDGLRKGREMGAELTTLHISIGKYDTGSCVTRQLNQRGLLGPGLLLSHCNTLKDDELDAIRDNKVGMSATPDTEMQMGIGQPVGFKATDWGCRCGLGIDVCCSTSADIFHQMRLQLQSQRHLEHQALPGTPLKMSRRCSEVLQMATLGGAKAVGLDHQIGSITHGKKADLILTRCDSLRLVPTHDPVDALVQYANASDIDTVFINGEIVKSKYELVHVDWPKLREEVRASTESIMERSKKAPQAQIQVARDAFVASYTLK